MAVPKQFYLIKQFLRKTYNREVNEWFRDVPADDETIATGRKAAKQACLIRPKDSMTLVQLKMHTFRYSVQKMHLKPEIYGLPVLDFYQSVVYQPQITIHWQERKDIAAANNRQPIRARYSVRYRGEYDTESKINLLGSKIGKIFNGATLHFFDKGRKKYSYRDKQKGYNLIVTALDETNAKKVIDSLLEIQDDNPLDADNLTESTSNKNWNAIEYVKVAGTNYKKPNRRPLGKVYYAYTEFKVHGLPKPIILASNVGDAINYSYI